MQKLSLLHADKMHMAHRFIDERLCTWLTLLLSPCTKVSFGAEEFQSVKADLRIKVDKKGSGTSQDAGVSVWRPDLDVDEQQRRHKLPLLPLVRVTRALHSGVSCTCMPCSL